MSDSSSGIENLMKDLICTYLREGPGMHDEISQVQLQQSQALTSCLQ